MAEIRYRVHSFCLKYKSIKVFTPNFRTFASIPAFLQLAATLYISLTDSEAQRRECSAETFCKRILVLVRSINFLFDSWLPNSAYRSDLLFVYFPPLNQNIVWCCITYS